MDEDNTSIEELAINYSSLSNRVRRKNDQLNIVLLVLLLPVSVFMPGILGILLNLEENTVPYISGAIALTIITTLIVSNIMNFLKDGHIPSHLKQFANDNKFEYLTNVDSQNLLLSQCVFANEFELKEVVKLKHDDLKFRLGYAHSIYYKRFFKHFYTDKMQEEDKVRDELTFLEIPLPAKMPRIFIDSKKNNSGNRGFAAHEAFIKEGYRELEGDFPKYFTVNIPIKYEVEALVLLNPKFMALLIDELAEFDIEVVGKNLYIYGAGIIDDKKTVKKLIESAKKIKELLSTTMKHDVKNIGDLKPDLRLKQTVYKAARRAESIRIVKASILLTLIVSASTAISIWLLYKYY